MSGCRQGLASAAGDAPCVRAETMACGLQVGAKDALEAIAGFMNVTFACPKCDQSARVEISGDADSFHCPKCRQAFRVPETAVADGRLTRCLVCPSTDLFVRKDFPQRVGLAIVVVAGIAFLVLAARRNNFYLGAIVLIAALLIDALGYFLVGMVTVCYRCRSEFRDVPINPAHEPFELAVAEKYRGATPPQLHG